MKRRDFIGLALASAALPVSARKADTRPRVLSFHHLHTDERISVTYRIGGSYQRGALHKLNKFLRDFRTGDISTMDPKLFDILYDVKGHAGNPDGVFEVISGYRSPKTNAMLRRTSSGVARNSLHLVGKAIDVRLTQVRTRSVRDVALRVARGGVGYYPRSDFVHLDTGRVRRWGA